VPAGDFCPTSVGIRRNSDGMNNLGKDVGDEVAFVVSETIPICSVSLEVDVFGGPE